jgi:hypothetical protein
MSAVWGAVAHRAFPCATLAFVPSHDDRPYELLQNGKPTGLVEIPVEWILDDASLSDPRGDRYSPPRDVARVWMDEFDKAYDEGTVLVLTVHPHISGHRSRIVALEQLIAHIERKARAKSGGRRTAKQPSTCESRPTQRANAVGAIETPASIVMKFDSATEDGAIHFPAVVVARSLVRCGPGASSHRARDTRYGVGATLVSCICTMRHTSPRFTTTILCR